MKNERQKAINFAIYPIAGLMCLFASLIAFSSFAANGLPDQQSREQTMVGVGTLGQGQDEAWPTCCTQAFKGCGGEAGDTKGAFQLRAYCTVVDYYGYQSTAEGASDKLKAVQRCIEQQCPVKIGGNPNGATGLIKVQIATTQSCTDSPNEAFSVQEGVSVSLGGKTFTSNANGVIEAELPAGTYPVTASWKDNVLAYVAQNGLRQKRNEDGQFTIRLGDKVGTLEVRMLTCDPEGLPKARAVVSEIGNGTVEVITTRGGRSAKGQAFVGRQLRDGDIVRINGTAKLKWLDGNVVINFEDPRGASIVIGPDSRPGGTTHPEGPSTLEVLQGTVRFLVPHDEDRDLPRDENGNIIKFGASTHTVHFGVKGTIFSVGYDQQTQVSTLIVEEGVVAVTPKNPALRPFDVGAGQQVKVSPTAVGPISFVNIANGGNATGRYIGCFKDTSAFDLDGFLEGSQTNTPQRCVQTCAAKGFAYAGVQYGQSCLCGNSYGKYGPATNCDYKCTGDASQICGGYAANSVYATSVSNPARPRRPE